MVGFGILSISLKITNYNFQTPRRIYHLLIVNRRRKMVASKIAVSIRQTILPACWNMAFHKHNITYYFYCHEYNFVLFSFFLL